MINAWSLAWEVLNGTMDETYPKVKVDDKTGLWKEPQPYPYEDDELDYEVDLSTICLLYTSPSPRDRTRSRMPSSA